MEKVIKNNILQWSTNSREKSIDRVLYQNYLKTEKRLAKQLQIIWSKCFLNTSQIKCIAQQSFLSENYVTSRKKRTEVDSHIYWGSYNHHSVQCFQLGIYFTLPVVISYLFPFFFHPWHTFLTLFSLLSNLGSLGALYIIILFWIVLSGQVF